MELSKDITRWARVQARSVDAKFSHFQGSPNELFVNTRINTLGRIGESLVKQRFGWPRAGQSQPGDFTMQDGSSVEVKSTVSKLDSRGREFIDFNLTKSLKSPVYDFYVIVVFRPKTIEIFRLRRSDLFNVKLRGSTEMARLTLNELQALDE